MAESNREAGGLGLDSQQESDARGWIKDQRQLQIALDTLAHCQATVTQLLAVLAVLQ